MRLKNVPELYRDFVKSRLNLISNRREAIGEFQTAAALEDGVTLEKEHDTWVKLVQSYLMAVEPLILENGLELPGAAELYSEVPLGQVEVRPPEVPSGVYVRDEAELEPKTIQVCGIATVLENNSAQARWDVEVFDDRSSGYDEREVSNSAPFPRGVYLKAIRATDQWLQEQGLGPQITGDEEAEGDYALIEKANDHDD